METKSMIPAKARVFFLVVAVWCVCTMWSLFGDSIKFAAVFTCIVIAVWTIVGLSSESDAREAESKNLMRGSR